MSCELVEGTVWLWRWGIREIVNGEEEMEDV